MIRYTLHIVSPVVFDERAKRAQEVLDGGNVFGIDFLRGPVDGEFGELTGRACIRAKFFLGYATKDLVPMYGPDLDSFLLGQVQPSEAMAKRAAKRAADAKKTPMRVKALREAERHLGYKERPAGSNKTRFGKWYGVDGQPWCAIFVSWCYHVAGSKFHYAYVPYIVNDARRGVNGLQVTRDPKPGDVVCFDWDGGVADHVGLYREDGSILTTEGNTGIGNDSNGGEVMHRTRENSQVEAFVRVGR